jgi:pimeloyl-ACP methyl ester carboxylesterase
MKLFFRKVGNGPPILLLHGLFGSADNWFTIAGGLREAGQVFALDLRNHGRSPHSDSFDYAVMVEDIYELLTDLNLRQVSLVGHSMGGMIAMKFSLEYPRRVDKLVVIDIAPRAYPLSHQEIIAGLSAIDPAKLRSRKQADDQLAGFITNPAVRQFLLKNLYRSGPGRYSWRLNLPVITHNLFRLTEGIQSEQQFRQPCLFIRGALSDYIRIEDEARIKILFPRAEIKTVAKATHWLPAENPAAVITAIKSFLDQNKSLH